MVQKPFVSFTFTMMSVTKVSRFVPAAVVGLSWRFDC